MYVARLNGTTNVFVSLSDLSAEGGPAQKNIARFMNLTTQTNPLNDEPIPRRRSLSVEGGVAESKISPATDAYNAIDENFLEKK